MSAATARTASVRVLIADDHRLFAEALEAILSSETELTVVGRAADGQEALELTRTLEPDVVLLDISMPVMDGFQAAAEIAKLPRKPAVLMLTGSNAPQDVDQARRLGASGYITKDAISGRLVEAILAAARAA
jgi:DNA-binding NarL/FixJ family response regulator